MVEDFKRGLQEKEVEVEQLKLEKKTKFISPVRKAAKSKSPTNLDSTPKTIKSKKNILSPQKVETKKSDKSPLVKKVKDDSAKKSVRIMEGFS